MTILRWLDPPTNPLEFVERFQKEYSSAQLSKAKDVADFGKAKYLEAWRSRMPGKSLDNLGYSHHKERFGKFFLVRSRVVADLAQTHGVHAVVWAVPPGPYLLEHGARSHSMTERMTFRAGRKALRKEGPAAPSHLHQGVAPRPWVAPANESIAVFARSRMPDILPLAIGRAQKAA